MNKFTATEYEPYEKHTHYCQNALIGNLDLYVESYIHSSGTGNQKINILLTDTSC